jgi:hypothetical protein
LTPYLWAAQFQAASSQQPAASSQQLAASSLKKEIFRNKE